MEEVAAVRRAARTAVEDVEPVRLRERIFTRLDEASMAPGVLTIESARAVRDLPVDGVADRAAGVQLIYEGLGLTRTLTHTDPWTQSAPAADTDASDGDDGDATALTKEDANLDVLLADILVARGFYLLARTEAADAAVRVVRAFGTDQTVRRETDDPSLDRNLESDVLELATITGVTAAGGREPLRLTDYATSLAADGLPSVERLLGEEVHDELARRAGADAAAADEARTSADH